MMLRRPDRAKVITQEVDLAQIGLPFAEIEAAFRDAEYRDFLDGWLDRLREKHEGYFQRQADPAGKAWPPLSPKTVKRKGHATILVDKERLKTSLASQTADSIRDVVSESLMHGLSFGTSVPYSIFHQDGAGRLPQRAHVGMSLQDVDELANEAADETVEKLKG